MSARDEQVTQAIRIETSRFLFRGGLYAAGFGAVAVHVLVVLVLATGDDFFVLPGGFALAAMTWSLLISQAARRGQLEGVMRVVVMVPLVSLPTGLFLAAHFL